MSNTTVHLLNVPLENDYQHTLYFESKANQSSYFQTKIKKSYTDFSYQRKDSVIRVPGTYDDLLGCNYVMYQNPSYGDKWFYAFITKIDYMNDGRADVHIQTDVMQTWLFDYYVLSSFVEREHVDDDTVGLHTIEEGLELGDFICNGETELNDGDVGSLACVLASTANPNTGKDESGGVYNGIYSASKYYRYKTTASLVTALSNLADKGKVESITGLFIAPSNDCVTLDDSESAGSERYAVNQTARPTITEHSVDTPTTINGYTPENNKLMCYPYNYLLVDNNCGGSVIYKYEYFEHDEICWFRRNAALTPGMSVRLSPLQYKGLEVNYNEGLVGGKYPICSFNCDMYTNWMTQNSVNNVVGIAAGLGSIALGVGGILAAPATGGTSLSATALAFGGAAAGGVATVASKVGQITQASYMPDQAKGNTNAGDVTTSLGRNCFTAYKMSIKKEFAQIIDNYFGMYGYKCNRVKVPNKNHRSRFWYTKTIDVNLWGKVPMEDLLIIKDCYNKGITFWKDTTMYRSYGFGTVNGKNAIIKEV